MIKSTNIGFWIVTAIATLVPIALARLGIDLYLMPQIEVGITFFLSIYTRPKTWIFFLYGLFIDVAYGNPLGVNALILVLLNYIIAKFKPNLSKQSMRMIIICFIYSILGISFLKYIIFTIYYASEIAPYYSDILINILINILFYPLLHLLLSNRKHYKNHEN